MKIAVVQHGKDHENLAQLMHNGIANRIGFENALYVNGEEGGPFVDDVDFFFIWNVIDRENHYKSSLEILKKLQIDSVALGTFCGYCGYEMSDDTFSDFRLKNRPCPKCERKYEPSGNFIFIFYGPHLLDIADEAFRSMLNFRFWASTDADWRLSRCLPQAITFVPHAMLHATPSPAENKSKHPLAVFCNTVDESYDGEAAEIGKKYANACIAAGYAVSHNPKDIVDAWVYVDRAEVGVPSVYAINAMAMGIPTLCIRSKFHVSHYPDLPIIDFESIDNLEEVLKTIKLNSASFRNMAMNRRQEVIRLFKPERVSLQWLNLAEYIMRPVHLIDHFQNKHNIPKYWGFQGGYNING